MPTVQSVFSSLPERATVCLECLTRQTTLRTWDIEHQLDAIGATLREAYCWGCATPGPVFGLGTAAA